MREKHTMKRARTITAVIAAAATATLAVTFALAAPVQTIFTESPFNADDPTFVANGQNPATEQTVVTDSAVKPIASTATPATESDTASAAAATEVSASESAQAAAEASSSAQAPAANEEEEVSAEVIEETETPAAEAAATEATSDNAGLSVPHTGESKVRNYQPIMENRSLNVGGHIIGYVDYYEQPSAPARGAGLWLGEDSTTDGTWGYFIGHNPGDFSGVMDLNEGDAVTVCDSEGLFRTYYVHDTFFVTTQTTWQDIESRVTGYGESIILQTCVGDNEHYRVVVAY